MTKILVVGLAVILAAAGSGRADSTTGQSGTSATSGSAGSSGSGHSSGSAHSSGSGAVQQGAVAPARSSGSGVVRPGAVAPSNRSGSVPVVRQYPTNVNVQNRCATQCHRELARPTSVGSLGAVSSPIILPSELAQSCRNSGNYRKHGQHRPGPPPRASLRRHQSKDAAWSRRPKRFTGPKCDQWGKTDYA